MSDLPDFEAHPDDCRCWWRCGPARDARAEAVDHAAALAAARAELAAEAMAHMATRHSLRLAEIDRATAWLKGWRAGREAAASRLDQEAEEERHVASQRRQAVEFISGPNDPRAAEILRLAECNEEHASEYEQIAVMLRALPEPAPPEGKE